ncbi:hypothetical protein ABIF83_005875 [Bradyrhizobium ottawaense]
MSDLLRDFFEPDEGGRACALLPSDRHATGTAAAWRPTSIAGPRRNSDRSARWVARSDWRVCWPRSCGRRCAARSRPKASNIPATKTASADPGCQRSVRRIAGYSVSAAAAWRQPSAWPELRRRELQPRRALRMHSTTPWASGNRMAWRRQRPGAAARPARAPAKACRPAPGPARSRPKPGPGSEPDGRPWRRGWWRAAWLEASARSSLR